MPRLVSLPICRFLNLYYKELYVLYVYIYMKRRSDMSKSNVRAEIITNKEGSRDRTLLDLSFRSWASLDVRSFGKTVSYVDRAWMAMILDIVGTCICMCWVWCMYPWNFKILSVFVIFSSSDLRSLLIECQVWILQRLRFSIKFYCLVIEHRISLRQIGTRETYNLTYGLQIAGNLILLEFHLLVDDINMKMNFVTLIDAYYTQDFSGSS